MKHGERSTYNRGCRCQPCRDDAARYERGRQWDLLNGRPRRVDKTGTQRRLQALYALGWDWHALSRRLDASPELTRQWATTKKYVYARTAQRVTALYDELSMRLPPETNQVERINATRARNRAARKGWAPPLSWDDDQIDNPDARPHGSYRAIRPRREVDEAVVQRLLAGQRVPATVPEKDEAMRRWKAAGKSERSLCQLLGWKDSRYGRETAA
jgi:hypothetical protein